MSEYFCKSNPYAWLRCPRCRVTYSFSVLAPVSTLSTTHSKSTNCWLMGNSSKKPGKLNSNAFCFLLLTVYERRYELGPLTKHEPWARKHLGLVTDIGLLRLTLKLTLGLRKISHITLHKELFLLRIPQAWLLYLVTIINQGRTFLQLNNKVQIKQNSYSKVLPFM